MKAVNIIFLIIIILCLSGCMGCGGSRPEVEGTPDSTVVTSDNLKDLTIYGLCFSKSDSLIGILIDSGDTMIVNIGQALMNGEVMGQPSVGDRLAVMLAADSQHVSRLLNETMLLGNWVMDDPTSGQGEVGIRIKEGGIAESINQESNIYNSWRIFNGSLIITLTRMGGGDMEETDSFRVVCLTGDTLRYVNKLDSMSYWRQRAAKKAVINIPREAF